MTSNVYSAAVIAESNQFTGTENWYKHHLCSIVYTDGAKWLATTLNCYWLIDDIAIFSRKFLGNNDFIVVKFTAKNNEGKLVFEDGNKHVLFRRKYDFADLETPKEAIKFYLIFDGNFQKHVLLLPREY